MRADYCPQSGEPCQSLCETPCLTRAAAKKIRHDALEEAARVVLTPMSGEQADITRMAMARAAGRIRALKEKA